MPGEDSRMVLYLRRSWALLLLLLMFGLMGVGVVTVTRPAVESVMAKLTNRLVPIYKVDTQEAKIAFSFDATWGTENTDKLLEILSANNVKTTFFLAGNWVSEYPEYVKKIAAQGHEIGNHSLRHPHMNSLTAEEIYADLLENHQKIKALIGKDPDLFRPPFGEYSNKVIEVAQSLGYYTVQWSIDSLDWKNVSASYIVDRISQAKPGDIILFHNAGKSTPEAVARLLPLLKQRGFQVVPVGELIYRDNYVIESHSGLQKQLPVAQ
jgi:polysaccharide deacetylase family sporulation protein PdaB